MFFRQWHKKKKAPQHTVVTGHGDRLFFVITYLAIENLILEHFI